MTEIWVPYGPVEVSFDIRQENLSQILEPAPKKVPSEELDIAADKVGEESVLVLSGTPGVQKFLEVLLTRNKNVNKILYPKALGALSRRKAQEFSVESEQLQIVEPSSNDGALQTDLAQIVPSIKSGKALLLSSVHYDAMFGLSSSASELLRVVTDLKKRAFAEFSSELPCTLEKSGSSEFALKQFEHLQGISSLELIEKVGTGILGISYGDLRLAHSKSLELWKSTLSIPAQRSERVIFGCGGGENDRNLTDAFSRALFPVLMKAALVDSESKICMLAECANGLGSEAFLRFVTGRLEPLSKLGGIEYVEGLEVLISFQKLQRDFELHILTTLPKFYASKFDLKTIGGAREAPASLLQQGSRAKILVLPDASSAFFKV